MKRARMPVAGLLWMGLVAAVAASTPPPVMPARAISVATLAPVVVSGEQPGPGLWRVSRGNHEMWILGTLTPLPRHMRWRSQPALEKLRHARQLLLPPSVEFGTKLGFFGKLLLLPRLVGIRNNPDHARLREILPPVTYARWQALKARYIGSDRGIEKWRPIFAGFKLYDAAVDKAGLTRDAVVSAVVLKQARHDGVETVSTSYRVIVDDPKTAMKDFRHERLHDVACFEQTLDRVESDVARMAERANAWATGDLERMRQLHYAADGMVCANALTGAGFARRLHMGDLGVQMRQAWMTRAEQATANNASTFAMLPVADLLDPHGYVAALRAAGYTVQAPDAGDAPTESSDTGAAPSADAAPVPSR